jgi:AcrR family transcriptional regulator
MPRVSEAHRESRREQIIAAALACFAEKGFQRTSMADIIAASGLSAGAIYLHFDSKQQIALAAGRRVLGRRLGELDAMPGSALIDPVSVVERLLGAMTHDLPDPRVIVQLWGEAASDPEMGALVVEIFGALQGGMTKYLTAWAAHRGVADPERWARDRLPTVLSLAQGFLLQSAVLPDFRADDYLASARVTAGPGLLLPE